MRAPERIAIDPANRTLGEVLAAQARNQPGKLAFRFEGRETDYAGFDRRANRAAHALAAAGVGRGDRVAHLGKNTDFYFEALFGATRIGAVTVPVNWRLAPPEIVYIVSDCRAKVLLVGPEYRELVERIAPELPGVELIVAMEGSHPDWPAYEE